MANGHGGYRQPSEPAPVSGPGALSQRTDGQGARYMAGGGYGEGQEMMDLQTSAPMAKTETMPRRGGRKPALPEGPMPTPLFAPTERPDEPITAGAPFGPGPGREPQIDPSSVSGILTRLGVATPESEQLLALAMRLGL